MVRSSAIEELLRAYAPVTMAREVIRDTAIDSCPIKAGNMVLLSFPAANRDPAMFHDADRVVLDRAVNPHAAFGLGIHRCVGSNLARMELTVAVATFLRRVPAFRMAGPVRWPPPGLFTPGLWIEIKPDQIAPFGRRHYSNSSPRGRVSIESCWFSGVMPASNSSSV